MNATTLPAEETARILQATRGLDSPYEDMEEFLVSIYPIFAGLPKEILRTLFRYRSDPRAYGALLIENFPTDPEIPPTPEDGKRSREKRTFVSEACVLGIAQILGQPIGYHDEKSGEIVHVLAPVKSEASATSSESSEIHLGFHTDFNFDKEQPEQPYNVVNPDYVVLFCLRSDQQSEAYTLYADVRNICQRLNAEQLNIMRQPFFEFASSYSFTGGCGSEKIWSVPSPLLKGPDAFPELSIDLLCGVRAINKEGDQVLSAIRDVCALPEVSSRIHLKPGNVLIMDNRKGAHGRTPFKAFFDGTDRWLHRVYVRRSLWELRKQSNAPLRVF